MSAVRAVVARLGWRRPTGPYAAFDTGAVLPEEPPAHWGPPVEIGCCGQCGRRRPVVAGRYVGCGHATA